MKDPRLQIILKELKSHANPENVAGMARYGITATNAYGVATPVIKNIAKRTGKDHALAGTLRDTELYEARVLAAFIDDPREVTREQMDDWAGQFDSWAICDGCCIHLFRKTIFAHDKAVQGTRRSEEFGRRAGFAMIATLAVHDKKAGDSIFLRYLNVIEDGSADERNMVKKAVNWALRQIGKRNEALRSAALDCARRILDRDTPAARWIARDAIRELTDAKIAARVKAATKKSI
jgi:3-methyladenine DNA glycosylase AlkD